MPSTNRMRDWLVAGALLAVLAALGAGQAVLDRTAQAQVKGGGQGPAFEVDPMWPKPLPNHWILGSVIGVSVDAEDHVWIIHRSSASLATYEKAVEMKTSSRCCQGAPPVLEFDQAGNLLRHWGGPGPGYQWPASNHGITIDDQGNVWIGGNGRTDSHILKFTKDGKFLKQIGRSGARQGPSDDKGQPTYVGGSNDPENFGRVAKVTVDNKANELYISDGYLNKRVAVLDYETGKMKRYWGAYGNKPDDAVLPPYGPDAPPAQQFRPPVHCAQLSHDGLLYVCDRMNDRIQVFTPAGKFVKEQFIAKDTLDAGSVWDIAFSKDATQRFIYLADGINNQVHILDRETLQELTAFGDGGRQPGQFYGVHSIATDSKGNIYTTDTWEGKRVQKFVYKGLAPVTTKDQGVVWPRSSSR